MNLQDEDFMRVALNLARNAIGRTSPNPLVGAVIVREGRIVGAGWHRKAGTPHAEIHALNMAGDLAKGATLYVTLEPCSHYGRTGPCAEAVVKAGIKRVVIGMGDPNPKVAGKGIAILERAGIEVRCGVLEDEARALNEVFLKWIAVQKPFVVLKTAMSLDGKIATYTGKSQWITGEAARRRVHEYRDTYDGIMVGIGTVLADNPSLTARLPECGLGGKPGREVARVSGGPFPGSRIMGYIMSGRVGRGIGVVSVALRPRAGRGAFLPREYLPGKKNGPGLLQGHSQACGYLLK